MHVKLNITEDVSLTDIHLQVYTGLILWIEDIFVVTLNIAYSIIEPFQFHNFAGSKVFI